MKERPILFSGPMVRAILEGRKAQTRRAMSPQPQMVTDTSIVQWDGDPNVLHRLLEQIGRKCPYGKIGDRLYVKEDYYQYGHWEPAECVKTKGGKQKWKFVPDLETVLFDEPQISGGIVWKSMDREQPFKSHWYRRLGRFMPRRYSRITLEITDIRVERLNQISEADAIAEGIDKVVDNSPFCGPDGWRDYSGDGLLPFDSDKPISSFRSLWESINGFDSWAANPWVRVIEFKRI